MPAPDDEPRTDDRPTTNIGGDLIGGNQINAQGSQGYIGQAQTVTQNFIRTDAPAPPLVPACPQPNAARLFGRDAILTELVNRLIGGAEAVAISAVRGLPGVGKSDLLRAVGNDARITVYFHGGVLYAELGPAPDPSQWLRRWLVALGSEPPRSDDAETLAGALRAALAPRRSLLILDDVWDAGLRAAKLLRDCGSPDCRALASSRSPRIAQEVAKGAPPLALDVLEAVPALALLRQSARDGDADVVARDEAGAAELVAALGGLPLALKLAGGWLRANHRQPRYRAKPSTGLLKVWRAQLAELRGDEAHPGLTDEKLSLDAIIGLSYAALPDDATRAAAALAAFGATPLDWDWDALAAVWATDEETTATREQALVASGLLDYDVESERYSLHQTVEAFLALRAEPAAYERHAAYYAALMQRCNQEIKQESTIDAALATL
ncbi:MAG TPA: NB-ARC domain-containing protein, partial [Roseiflexaceae bacterium]